MDGSAYLGSERTLLLLRESASLRFWKEDGRFCSWRVPLGLSAESAGDLGYLRGDEFSSTIVANLWAKRKERT